MKWLDMSQDGSSQKGSRAYRKLECVSITTVAKTNGLTLQLSPIITERILIRLLILWTWLSWHQGGTVNMTFKSVTQQ